MDATLDAIDRYVASPPQTSVVMVIGPDVARDILGKYNSENRGLKPHKIRPMIGDLQRGGWLLTGETIKFSPRRLLDGQNRLTACMESGIPIKTHVVVGIDDAAFALIDTGAPRTSGDVLVCAGIDNATLIAHAISRLNTWDNGGGRTTIPLSPNQVLTLYESKYRDLQDHVAWGRELQAATGLRTASWGTTLHYAFTKAAGRTLADRFFRAWIDGDANVQQAAVLRRRVAQLAQMQAGNIRANVFYAMAIKSFAAFHRGQPIDVVQIKWGEGEPFPALRKEGGSDGEAEATTDPTAKTGRRPPAYPRSYPVRVTG